MGCNDAMLAKLVSSNLDKSHGLDHFVARTPSEKEEIFKLRYDAYCSVGHIRESTEARLSDRYDCENASSIFGITLEGTLVSTIRLHVLSSHQKASISHSVFRDHLDPLIDDGEKIADGSRMAVRCGNSGARRSVVLYTLSLAVAFAFSVGADRGAMIARESHVTFYKRYGFNLISGPRAYRETSTPLNLMMINLRDRRLTSLPLLTPQLPLSRLTAHKILKMSA